MLSPILNKAATLEAVSLEEAKRHLRIEPDVTEEDSEIEEMIGAAVDYLDGYSGVLGRAIMLQTWSQEYTQPTGDLILPLGPVQSVVSVSSGDAVFTKFRLLKDGRGWFLRPDGEAWPSSVIVTFEAGEAICPDGIKRLIKLHVGTMYEVRGSVDFSSVKPSFAYEAVLARYRLVRL